MGLTNAVPMVNADGPLRAPSVKYRFLDVESGGCCDMLLATLAYTEVR
jgi:hypothetical protein